MTVSQDKIGRNYGSGAAPYLPHLPHMLIMIGDSRATVLILLTQYSCTNLSRQDTNTLCEEAGMYLNLRDIAAGAIKFSWDMMFQDAALHHRSEHLANAFSQRLCKINLALNEL